MREAYYLGSNVAIIDFSAEYYQTSEELVSSSGFKIFLDRYLKDLAVRDIKVYRWLTSFREMEDMISEMVKLTKQLLVLDVDEIFSPLFTPVNRYKALYIVEDAYNYWRKKQRFSVLNANANLSFVSFIDADSKYNQLVLNLYRTCEEKLQGKSNKIYRQLQAGTNASCIVKNYKWEFANSYSLLKNIPFINTVMLRTPILLHTLSNKRTGVFKQIYTNPIKSLSVKYNEWYCYPAKVGGLLAFVYFHRDFMANGLSLSNLFELASEEECVGHKPDLICIFGNQDDKEEGSFYHDEVNDIWVGSVSYDWKIDYFGYIKKIILTLHNVAKMQRGALPIHGSMMRIHFRNGNSKSLILIGDSGAGKSETIEAVRMMSDKDIGDDRIENVEIIFDDMGSLHIGEDGHVYANGTETGAFVRLDDLDKSTAYKDMERSIFLNPESSNARVINPVASYELINQNHPVDVILYANNYTDAIGVEKFLDYQSGKNVFLEGKRMALGTTQEKGLSSTFFANPFGPMQQQELCLEIMENVFSALYNDGAFIGQIYTNLGTDHKENLQESAKELLELLKKM